MIDLSGFSLSTSPDAPAMLAVGDGHLTPLVEIFTADEQRARTSQAYVTSAVGARLRVISSDALPTGVALVQRDEQTGLEVHTRLLRSGGALAVSHRLTQTDSRPVVVTAVSSVSVGFGAGPQAAERCDLWSARSEWLAENRWTKQPLTESLPTLSLPIHAQNGRGHGTITSHGAWPSGEWLPVGAIADHDGVTLAWQLETGAGWHVDLSQNLDGLILSLMGPTDLEHHFAVELHEGESFDVAPAAIAVSAAGLDQAFGALTSHRREIVRATEPQLPIVYNDFMNTLMGQPSSGALRPLIQAAAEAGAEVFCIDAGWFADPSIGDWWSTVGEWQESAERFDERGLIGLTQQIRAAGMRSGLWLEPEVVGVNSTAARSLPEEAFFQRFGVQVREHDRFHLDFRHPAARAHLDEAVDRIIATYGVSYLKLDYNINPGAGTERDARGAGAGLLGHVRAFASWLDAVRERHPRVTIENCASGAMRADYALLQSTHLQSTSDQQDFRLYPPVAASAPASILPEQAGNWAYPAVEMSESETAFTLVTGLSGRLYLAGFLGELSARQQELVRSAVGVHKSLRGGLPSAVPFWPLGLPRWDDPVVCLGLESDEWALLFLWIRSAEESSVELPGVRYVESVFRDVNDGWSTHNGTVGFTVTAPGGYAAQVLRVERVAA